MAPDENCIEGLGGITAVLPTLGDSQYPIRTHLQRLLEMAIASAEVAQPFQKVMTAPPRTINPPPT